MPLHLEEMREGRWTIDIREPGDLPSEQRPSLRAGMPGRGAGYDTFTRGHLFRVLFSISRNVGRLSQCALTLCNFSHHTTQTH